MQVSTTPTAAIDLLAELTALPGHTFWTDDVRLVVGTDGDRRVSSHRLVTDGHLIALASRYRSRLVTFDRALAEHAPAGVVQVL